MNQQNFIGDLEFGKKGELYVRDFLKQKHNIDPIIVNEAGHDIIVNGIRIECKSDKWIKKTGNVCLELFSHVGLRNPGWMQYSDCDFLAYIQVGKQGFEIVTFYEFMSLKEFVFVHLLRGDWWCNTPLHGRISSAHINRNVHVRNLLVPRGVIAKFEVDDKDIFRAFTD